MKTRVATFAALAFAGVLSLVSAVPPPKPDRPGPDGPRIKACSIERPHRPHDWKGPEGVTFHCPGVPAK